MENVEAGRTLSYPNQSYRHPYDQAEAIWNRFQRYRTVFFSYWWIVVLTTGIGLAVEGWNAFTRPASYQSTGKIIVSGRISLPEATMYNDETANFFGTQIELMQGAEVRQKAQQQVQSLRPDLAPVPVDIGVSQIPRTSIFVLQAGGSSPDYVKAYLDALMEAYIDVRRGMFSEKSKTTLSAITDELMKVETDLRQAEDKLLNWQKENNLVLLQQEGNSDGVYLAGLKRNLAERQTEYNLLDRLNLDQTVGPLKLKPNNPETGSANAGAGAKADDDAITSSAMVSGSVPQEYIDARQQLLLLQAKLQQLLENEKPNHPEVRNMQVQINQQQRLVSILRQHVLDMIDSQKGALGVQIRSSEAEISDWDQRALDLSRRIGEYDQLKGNVDRQQALYDKLLSTIQSIDVNNNIQQDVVSIYEYGSPPDFQIVNIAHQLMVGVLFGVAAGCGILFLIGILDDRVMSLSELKAVFAEEEVVGLVPKMPEGQTMVDPLNDRHSILMEAFRNIRSWLVLTPWEGEKPKIIAITSSVPEEGKTTAAANLAITLAAGGSEVLLLDADIRRGVQHKLFQIDSEPGTGNIVTDDVKWNEVVRTVDYEHLHVIPRGEYFGRQTEKFLSTAFESFLSEIAPKFDYVIIDTGPILAVDETTTIAAGADVTLMVVRCAYTGIRAARKAMALLVARHARVGGVIYNGMEMSSMDNPYYRYVYKPVEEDKSKD